MNLAQLSSIQLFQGRVVMGGGSSAFKRVFVDDFESGAMSLWAQDGTRNMPQVVTTSIDGVAGPYSGTYMARCNWNSVAAWSDPDAFETAVLGTINYVNELFMRVRVRCDADQNANKTDGSPTKILRFFTAGDVECHHQMSVSAGLRDEGTFWGTQNKYWGGGSGDTSAGTSAWHLVERYFNQSTGKITTWLDGVKRVDITVTPGATRLYPFYLASNWGDAESHTFSATNNHIYFDKIEFFSDYATGDACTGSLSDATIAAV